MLACRRGSSSRGIVKRTRLKVAAAAIIMKGVSIICAVRVKTKKDFR